MNDMKYRFQVGDLVEVQKSGKIGLVTVRSLVPGGIITGRTDKYTILIGGTPWGEVYGHELTKVSESNEL